MIVPATSVRNFTPSSVATASGSAVTAGTGVPLQMFDPVGGCPVPPPPPSSPPGTSRFPLSSTARDSTCTVPLAPGVHVYDQLPVPRAGCHVVPPSTDTSTPAT